MLADESRITLRADVRDKTYAGVGPNVEGISPAKDSTEQLVNMTAGALEQASIEQTGEVPHGGSYIRRK